MNLRRLCYLFPCGVLLVFCFVEPSGGQVREKSAPDQKDSAPPEDTNQQLLQVVGSLSGGQLYQTYLNIGFLADGKAEGTYQEKDALAILQSVLSLLDTLNKQLDKVAKLSLNKTDREAITECQRLGGLLQKQAAELQTFWKTGDKKSGEKYEEIRKDAWTGISKLLDLK